jgi:hypothetical protein
MTPTRHNPALGIMTQLMTDCPAPVDRLEKSRERPHVDVVGTGNIEGAVPADAENDAGRADQRLGLRQDEVFGKRRRRRRDVRREILALVALKTVKRLRNGMPMAWLFCGRLTSE